MTCPLFRRTLAAGLDAWGLSLDEQAVERCVLHYQMLVEANRRFNLTAVTGEAEAASRHFLDCLALLRYHAPAPGQRLIDVGAGAGFPGLVLKTVCKDMEVTLLEASRKKVLFLQEVINALGLSGARAVWGRAEEEARRPGMRESFDWAVARGVAAVRVLSEYCLPFVKDGGFFVAYKGPGAAQELQDAGGAFDKLAGEVAGAERFLLPTGEERNLVWVRKIGTTPARFPRRAGVPGRRPL